jgi:hypothetical protein
VDQHRLPRHPVTLTSERVHVDDFAHHFGAFVGWCIAHLAVQHWVGVLPERWPWPCPGDRAGIGVARPSVSGFEIGARLDGRKNKAARRIASCSILSSSRGGAGPGFCRFPGLDSTEAERRQAGSLLLPSLVN